MGMDPLTLGVLGSAGASLYGAISGGRAQNQAIRQQQQRYGQLSDLVQGQMQQGTNPYADMITKFAQSLSGPGGVPGAATAPSGFSGLGRIGAGFTGPGGVPSAGGVPTAAGYTPTSADMPQGIDVSKMLTGSGFNTGQDSLLQLMRRSLTPTQDPSLSANLANVAGGNTAFDNSALYRALAPMDQFNTQQQVDALHSQARSLGQLAGGPMQNAEALLRSQMGNSINARNAQIQQQSFESAQQRAMQALGLQTGQEQAANQFNLGAYGAQVGANQGFLNSALQAAGIQLQPSMQTQQLGTQVGLANAAGQNAAGQFNASQQNQYDQMLRALQLQAYGQAGGLQAQQQGQNLQALGILGGMQAPGVPQNPVPGALGDMSQMLMLYPFLRGMMPQQQQPSFNFGAVQNSLPFLTAR